MPTVLQELGLTSPLCSGVSSIHCTVDRGVGPDCPIWRGVCPTGHCRPLAPSAACPSPKKKQRKIKLRFTQRLGINLSYQSLLIKEKP